MSARVLVVEDDEDIRDAVCALLADEGYDVACCDSVDGARQAVAEKPPNVVVLDLLLKGEVSDGLLQEWQALPTHPPVVLMSAAIGHARAVADHHGVPLVIKPFDADVLLTAVKQAIQSDGV